LALVDYGGHIVSQKGTRVGGRTGDDGDTGASHKIQYLCRSITGATRSEPVIVTWTRKGRSSRSQNRTTLASGTKEPGGASGGKVAARRAMSSLQSRARTRLSGPL
jgi:hypothetical protein